MQRNWLAFIGKISYGIYILHLAFSCLFQLALEQIWKNEAVPFWPSLLFLVVYLALLLLGAYVSFRFFESRFLRLKAHFSIPLK